MVVGEVLEVPGVRGVLGVADWEPVPEHTSVYTALADLNTVNVDCR